MVQTNGLAGHEHEFYQYIAQGDWNGAGTATYSDLEEGRQLRKIGFVADHATCTAGSYWFNGMVPNAVLVNSTTLQNKTQQFLDYVLNNQDSTGWLGPEVGTSKPRYLWGRLVLSRTFFGTFR
jgi:hypothetical protein